MTDESLMLDIDIILKEYEQNYEQKFQRMMEEDRQALADQKAEIAEKEAEIADKEAEIDRLKKLLQHAGISS